MSTVLRPRRGQFQLFMILLFVLLVIVAIVLLTLDRKRLEVERPEATQDFADQYANQYLISMLRTQTPISVRAARTQNLADLLIVNEDGKYDEAVQTTMSRITPSTMFVSLSILYPSGRTLTLTRKTEFTWDELVVKEHQETPGSAKMLLPGYQGNIAVVLTIIRLDAPPQGVEFTRIASERGGSDVTSPTTTPAPPIAAEQAINNHLNNGFTGN